MFPPPDRPVEALMLRSARTAWVVAVPAAERMTADEKVLVPATVWLPDLATSPAVSGSTFAQAALLK